MKRIAVLVSLAGLTVLFSSRELLARRPLATAPRSSIVVTPRNPALSEGATLQFTASVNVTWTASCGSIDSNAGLYTAPLARSWCTITATATDGSGNTGIDNVSVTSPITITPATATTLVKHTQQFTANTPVTWAASCGSVDSTGLFTAPATRNGCTITATAATGIAYTARAMDTVVPFSVTPANPAMTEGATQQFVFNVPAIWTASCGTIDPNAGLYTAPLVNASCSITAVATDGSGATATAAATVTSPLTITPASAKTVASQMQQFTANMAATWTASCGSVDATGLFTAPAMQGSCQITATAANGIAYATNATDTVISGLPVNYTTWKNDVGRTGLQANETTLAPSNVNTAHFGIAWSATLDGVLYAQPLYMSNLMVNGAAHNVVFFATENDSVYAFDGDSGAQLWQTNFLLNGATTVPIKKTLGGFLVQSGITSTPTIDLSSNTIYVVAETLENTAYVFRLHALDVTTGSEKPGSPVLIAAPGFVPLKQIQRPGLLLANGNLYLAFGSSAESPVYHGWIFAYNTTTLGQLAVWNSTPGGSGGSVWMGGAGVSADSDGNIYVATANGFWDGSQNLSQSVVKLTPSLTVLDYFSPFDNVAQSTADLDLGSGGVLVVPDQNGPFPHVLIVSGKPTPIYVLNRDHMGQFNSGSDLVLQRLDGQLGPTPPRDTSFSTPAFWNQNVYFVAVTDVLKQFSLDPTTGQLSNAPISSSKFLYYSGSQPVVSSNGNSNAIVWTLDGLQSGKLRAYDATNVSNLLYTSPYLGFGSPFNVPTVANGHVYVALGAKVTAFASH